jgi:hypothetical protein
MRSPLLFTFTRVVPLSGSNKKAPQKRGLVILGNSSIRYELAIFKNHEDVACSLGYLVTSINKKDCLGSLFYLIQQTRN